MLGLAEGRRCALQQGLQAPGDEAGGAGNQLLLLAAQAAVGVEWSERGVGDGREGRPVERVARRLGR